MQLSEKDDRVRAEIPVTVRTFLVESDRYAVHILHCTLHEFTLEFTIEYGQMRTVQEENELHVSSRFASRAN